MSGPETHAEWLRLHGIDEAPLRSRFRFLKDRIAELERLADQAERYSAQNAENNPGTSRTQALRADRYRRTLQRFYADLELFDEPEPVAECVRCGGPIFSMEERFSSPACKACLVQLELKGASP